MTIAIITSYVVGVIVSYLFNRWVYSDEWTISRRTQILIVSLFSWIFIIFKLFLAFINYVFECLENHNKAKW